MFIFSLFLHSIDAPANKFIFTTRLHFTTPWHAKSTKSTKTGFKRRYSFKCYFINFVPASAYPPAGGEDWCFVVWHFFPYILSIFIVRNIILLRIVKFVGIFTSHYCLLLLFSTFRIFIEILARKDNHRLYSIQFYHIDLRAGLQRDTGNKDYYAIFLDKVLLQSKLFHLLKSDISFFEIF